MWRLPKGSDWFSGRIFLEGARGSAKSLVQVWPILLQGRQTQRQGTQEEKSTNYKENVKMTAAQQLLQALTATAHRCGRGKESGSRRQGDPGPVCEGTLHTELSKVLPILHRLTINLQ